MKTFAAIVASVSTAFTPLPVTAQQTLEFSMEQRMLLRCSAAFALVAHGQEVGNEAAQQYPPMGERGREFFVRSAAEVMEKTGIGREEINAALSAEAQNLIDEGSLEDVMPVCLAALERSGL